MDGWFSNKGQIAQLLVGSLGTLAALINAWPAIRNLQFLTWGPLILYAITTLFAASLFFGRKHAVPQTLVEGAPADQKNNAPRYQKSGMEDVFSNRPEKILALRGGRTSVTLKKGDYWRSGEGVNAMKVVFHGIVDQRAELEISGFLSFVGGSMSAKKGEHILLPDVSEGQARAVAYVLAFADGGYFAIDVVGVEHLNAYSQEVTLVVIRCRAFGDA
jgi:hypothetical protein